MHVGQGTWRGERAHHRDEELPDLSAERRGEHARDPDDGTGGQEWLAGSHRLPVSGLASANEALAAVSHPHTLYPLSRRR